MLVEAKWRPKCMQKISELVQRNKRGRIWIEISPDLSVGVCHILIKESCLLNLSLIITLQDHSNKELQEYQIHDVCVANKESVNSTPISTPYRVVPMVNIVLIGRVPLALHMRMTFKSKRCLYSVPRVSCADYEESQEGIEEVLEVYVIIHDIIPLVLPEQNHSEDRVYKQDNSEKTPYV